MMAPMSAPRARETDASTISEFASEGHRFAPPPSPPTVIAADESGDPLLAFDSQEFDPPPFNYVPPPPPPPRRFWFQPGLQWLGVNWIHSAVGLLAVVALVQGSFITFWWGSGRIASPVQNGSVSITSEPSGARVSIDGEARGVTPLTVTLLAGSHRVDLTSGTKVRTHTLNVGAGRESSLHAALEVPASKPAVGGLSISTEPSGARVWVDDHARGQSPVSISDLAPGPHQIRVSGPRGSVTRTVSIEAGVVASLVIPLRASPAASATSTASAGWLSIQSPFPVQIADRGTVIGSSDTSRIAIPSGQREVELTNATLGYRTRRSVQVAPGQTTLIALDVPNGTLHINALPWAQVAVDGRAIGETPIANLSLPIGSHEVVFRHPELGEQRQIVVIKPGPPVRVGVDLRKGRE